jgi:hypothetical protein
MWRLRPSVLVGFLWATVATRVVRHRLKRAGIRAFVPRPPHLNPRAGRGVMGALRRLEPNCLETALVQQAWLASQGILRDVVIGVPPSGIGKDPAHAWLDGTDHRSPTKYIELHRLAPPSVSHRQPPAAAPLTAPGELCPAASPATSPPDC